MKTKVNNLFSFRLNEEDIKNIEIIKKKYKNINYGLDINNTQAVKIALSKLSQELNK